MRQTLPMKPPVSPYDLNRLRLRFRARSPSEGLGAHRHRRMGQSLEFRDFRDYVPGDDVRAIDWSASLRSRDRIVKSFEAEERRTLIILLDCRPAMRLPEGADKLRVAFWIAQLLVDIALAERDHAVIVPLFSAVDHKPVKVRGGRDKRQVSSLFETLLNRVNDADTWDAVPRFDGRAAVRALQPAAAVVLLSDMLFDDPEGRFAGLVRRAQKSYRSFHVFELNSWPMERSLMAGGPFRLAALEGRDFGETHFEAADQALREAEQAMERHLLQLRHAFAGPGLVWPHHAVLWPDTADGFQDWFQAAFRKAALLPSLLSRGGQ